MLNEVRVVYAMKDERYFPTACTDSHIMFISTSLCLTIHLSTSLVALFQDTADTTDLVPFYVCVSSASHTTKNDRIRKHTFTENNGVADDNLCRDTQSL